jgi:hypothetical protein
MCMLYVVPSADILLLSDKYLQYLQILVTPADILVMSVDQ